MDNVSIHCNPEVEQLIEGQGHLIRYLPPYSPDFNPIELSFSTLKAWIARNWVFLRSTCDNYGQFLELALRDSNADQHAARQFKYAADGIYMEEQDLITFYR